MNRRKKIRSVLEIGKENMSGPDGSLSRVDRNALERVRRLHMKVLFSKLAFLLPTLPAKSLPGLLDQAISHLKQSKQRVEMLNRKKQLLEGSGADDQTAGLGRSGSPVFTVRELNSMVEVDMKIGSNKKFMLHQVIQVLEEEAAQVVALSYSNVGDITFCTIHGQAVSARIGIETSSVQERLKELIF